MECAKAILALHICDRSESNLAAIIRAYYPSPPLAVLRQAKEALEDAKNQLRHEMDMAELLGRPSGLLTPESIHKCGSALTALNSLLAGELQRPEHDHLTAHEDHAAFAEALDEASPPPPSEPTDKERIEYVRQNFANAIHYCCRVDGDEWNTNFYATLDKWMARDAAIRAAMARSQEKGGRL
jgi:hypothetical protein